MSKTVELPNEVYAVLEKQAQARNASVSEVISQLIQEVERAHLAAVIEQMKAEGLIATFEPADITAPVNFKPIIVKGRPVSEIIIEERR